MALGAIRAARAAACASRRTSPWSAATTRRFIEFTDPPLTTIRQPVAAMGAAAVQALVHEIHGIPAPRAEYLFRPELVVRGSTAKAPVRRPVRRRAAEAVEA